MPVVGLVESVIQKKLESFPLQKSLDFQWYLTPASLIIFGSKLAPWISTLPPKKIAAESGWLTVDA